LGGGGGGWGGGGKKKKKKRRGCPHDLALDAEKAAPLHKDQRKKKGKKKNW